MHDKPPSQASGPGAVSKSTGSARPGDRLQPAGDLDLTGIPYPEVLAHLNQNGSTGALMVTGASVERRLLFVDGELRAAVSTSEHEKLTPWMVHRGFLSEEQKALLLLKQEQDEAASLSQTLVNLGFVDQMKVDQQLKDLALHIIKNPAVDVPRRINFTDRLADVPWDILPDLSTQQVILAVARVFPELESKRENLEPLDQFAHASSDLDTVLQEYELTPTEAFLVSRLGSATRLSDLLATCGVDEDEAIAALYTLRLSRVILTQKESLARGVKAVRGRSLVDDATFTKAQRMERDHISDLARSLPDLGHYEALDVGPDATPEEIEEAWDNRLRRYSPERRNEEHLEDKGDELRAIVIRLEGAYEVLSAPAARTRYDQILCDMAEPDEETDALPVRKIAPEAREQLVAANLRRADELMRLGEPHLAIQALEAASKLDPQPMTFLRLARLQRKNPAWAHRVLQALRKAVELDPGFTNAWVELAEFWRHRGHSERYRKALERALASDPAHENAARLYRHSFGDRRLKQVLRRHAK